MNSNKTATVTTLQEAEILQCLPNHENIIKFIEIIDDPEHQESIFLVTEIAEKGIVMDVKPHQVTKPYSNDVCRHIFEQLVEAVDHCKYPYEPITAVKTHTVIVHRNKIIHRDIKPQNLVLSNDSTVKLIDFGNATCITNGRLKSSCSVGSPAFMAPELLKKGMSTEHHSLYFVLCTNYP